MARAIFLDRDNTLIEDKGYVHEISDLVFLPGVIEGLKKLQQQYILIIVTNQSGIARGYYQEKDYLAFREEMHTRLGREKIKIRAEYFCPHHPGAEIPEYKKECSCRKPKTGMFERAITCYNIKAAQSWTLGDKPADMEAGKSIGTRCVGIISREKDSTREKLLERGAEEVFESFNDAAQYILEHTKEPWEKQFQEEN